MEMMDALIPERDENVDQMIQQIDAVINKVLDNSTDPNDKDYLFLNTQALKDLIISRKILMSEKVGYDVLKRTKEILENGVI